MSLLLSIVIGAIAGLVVYEVGVAITPASVHAAALIWFLVALVVWFLVATRVRGLNRPR